MRTVRHPSARWRERVVSSRSPRPASARNATRTASVCKPHRETRSLLTVYERRQVGKTELLVRLLAGRRAIYFYADCHPRPDQGKMASALLIGSARALSLAR